MKEKKSLLERLGLTPRDMITLIIILVNTYLLINGHQQLDGDLIKLDRAVTQNVCNPTTADAR